MGRRLRHTAPGRHFSENYLLGNGWIGLCAGHQPIEESITLSHIAFFSGEAPKAHSRLGAPEAFRAARKAALAGENPETHLSGFWGEKGNYGTSLPVGCLRMVQPNLSGIRAYERWLDLTDGLSECQFEHDGGLQRRVLFCSHPDHCAALYITDSAPEGMRLLLEVEGEHVSETAVRKNALSFTAKALETRHSDGRHGVTLTGLLTVSLADGSCAASDGKLSVTGAHEALLILTMETDFSGEGRTDARREITDWPELLAAHRADFSARMNRQTLRLRGRSAEEDTQAQEAALMHTLARYLTLSASREDSPLPMSLQGVWNDGVACQIGWTCDMHLDINTQMNYWLCEPGALPECHRPLFRWMEERLLPQARAAARDFYGLPGWSAELVSNAWGFAAPYWNRSLAPCPGCGAWLADDCAEHALYADDRRFAADFALPVLEELADFYLSYLTENGEGQLIGGPSISPENAFLTPEGKRFASMGCTFDTLTARQALTDYLAMAALVGLPEDERQREARSALERLAPYRVLPDGTLAEWAHDHPAFDPQHRHISHLLGLFPFDQITPEKTPELARAARETLRRRLTPYEGWEDTGWARSMLALYSARLGDGEQAWFHLKEMMARLKSAGGLIMHPPTRGAPSFAPVWEIDGNTGFGMAVSEMLLQSHGGVLRLLPALPDAWPEGHVSGLRARDCINVDLSWQDGRLTRAALTARNDRRTVVFYQGREQTICLVAGVPWEFNGF